MQAHLNGIKEAYELARNRASRELCTALDAGGAVYLIGTGAFEEFTGEAPESVEIGGFSRQKWPTVRELWTKRIDCSNALHDHSDFTDSKSTSSCQGGKLVKQHSNTKIVIYLSFMALCVCSHFQHLHCGSYT